VETVAVTGLPPLTVDVNERLLRGVGVTVNVVCSVLTPEDAVNVTAVLLHCGALETDTC
jgi:hypothetical protein